jgi:hypothetical protein
MAVPTVLVGIRDNELERKIIVNILKIGKQDNQVEGLIDHHYGSISIMAADRVQTET